MIKNKELFFDLIEGFLADVYNANSSRSEITGHGTVRCWVKYNMGCPFLLEPRYAFWMPSYAPKDCGVIEAIDGQGGNDPVHCRPNHQNAQ